MEKIKQLFEAHKITVILVIALVLLGGLGYLGVQKFTNKQAITAPEMDLPFDSEGPYGLLLPRNDGNALVLNLKRTASYDSISYELAYTSSPDDSNTINTKNSEDGDGIGVGGSIDRGVVGNIDTKSKKGEYEQEILFGTCSKNVCKYDKGVENGTLTLHIVRASEGKKRVYRMNTQWHIQRADLALGNLSSGDSHLNYTVDASRIALTNIGYSIINDLTGVPKLPADKAVVGKVYALNVPIAKSLPGGDVSVELSENPSSDAKIYRYNDSANNWDAIDTKVDGSKLSGKASGGGIYAVLTSKK